MLKIQSINFLEKEIKKIRKKNIKIVFTNGCFDLLHIGHIRLLDKAKSLGDILIVGLNSDSSVRALKGSKRPLVPEKERAEILSALSSVDYITIFNENTAEKLISSLKPDIYVKGTDYMNNNLLERYTVENYRGEVILFPLVTTHSSSNLIKKISDI